MYTKEFLAQLYKKLYTIRVFESRCIQLYRQGLIRGYFHPYLGEEAIAVGACAAIERHDYITSTHRGHGHCIAKGAKVKFMVAELLGKKTGYCKGLGGSMHIADLAVGNLGANAIVGANLPLGVGAALASSMKKDGKVTVVFISDGASNNGVFSESMNLAAIWNLPLITIVENNQYAVSTPITQSTCEANLFKRGEALGITSQQIDGNDVLTVYETVKNFAEHCRRGEGPFLIEAITFRHGGHHVNDPGLYMPKEKLDYYMSIDPIKRGRQYLLEKGGASDNEVKEIEATVEKNMEEAIRFAQSSDELAFDDFLAIVEGY
ncbi:thiamine pyrophosphate-dependent dehydrogenase E1 component subunit alpha [candidate division KSB1 bacterium]|nr:thiamine pyrophosphate-dependent dehydrogenase E1 component subunit alpha [candidate division KSB1 bacterium]